MLFGSRISIDKNLRNLVQVVVSNFSYLIGKNANSPGSENSGSKFSLHQIVAVKLDNLIKFFYEFGSLIRAHDEY